jgi:hypothetical protein
MVKITFNSKTPRQITELKKIQLESKQSLTISTHQAFLKHLDSPSTWRHQRSLPRKPKAIRKTYTKSEIYKMIKYTITSTHKYTPSLIPDRSNNYKYPDIVKIGENNYKLNKTRYYLQK